MSARVRPVRVVPAIALRAIHALLLLAIVDVGAARAGEEILVVDGTA